MWRAHYLNERGEWKVLPRGKIIATLGWGMAQLGGMSFKIARVNEVCKDGGFSHMEI